MIKRFLFVSFLIFSFPAHSDDEANVSFATLETSMGNIRIRLFSDKAPEAVQNFIGLATGTKSFRDANTGKKVKGTPFYKNMIFHKVHPQLGIQTGCPWGNGKGWPGYTLPNEKNDLTFDRPYLVFMAKIRGDDNSIGSQFVISTRPLPYLNKEYTVMGAVEQGFEIVDQISRVPADTIMRPLEPVILKAITVGS